ncbi:MAG: hypothetical protein AAGN46_13040 [Acidobacteriota bacterium]
MQPRFDAADRDALADATRRAELLTSGEIVTVIVERCSHETTTRWRLAALGGCLAAVLAAVAFALGDWWPTVIWAGLPPLIGVAAGWLIGGIAGVERLATPPETLERRARERAERAFLEAEVFATRDRTGILIFLALAEHQVVVLGDRAIDAAVEPGTWQELVDGIVAGVRRGEATAALVAAIDRCGEILRDAGVERRDDDVDELSDRPRILER